MSTLWFTYRQNNSGGSFDHVPEDGIGIAVFIEARNKAHANTRAERIGLYFNGCDTGRDCSCCGDRWSEAYSEGTAQPEQYEEPWRAVADGEEPKLDWGIASYMHPLTGDRAFLVATKATP